MINLHSGLGCPGAPEPEGGMPLSEHYVSEFAHTRELIYTLPRTEVKEIRQVRFGRRMVFQGT